VLVIMLGADSVARVSDVGTIPSGIPLAGFPDLSLLTPAVVTGALAVAAIILVQGAGVAESAPNPDRSRSNPNADIAAQGFGNVAAGVFSGQPVGGSVGQTALNVSAWAKSRWAAIWSGIWMLVILIALSRIVGLVAMPTLAAVLIYAAVFLTTLLATMFLAGGRRRGIGLALSLVLQLNQEAINLRVVRLVPDESGRFTEAPVPKSLSNDEIVVLDVYGSLFYAGARTLPLKLPDPAKSRGAAVVLRLRGRTTRAGSVQLYRATPVIGKSTYDAFLGAQSHLVRLENQPD
jgi:sulfate permease, SulP family